MNERHRLPVVFCAVLAGCASQVQRTVPTGTVAVPEGFTRQDHLRGTVTAERAWWDVQHYALTLQVFPETKSLRGSNVISFKTVQSGDRMQIDLQPPLAITRVSHGGRELTYDREGKVYWIQFPHPLPAGVLDRIEVHYEGVPVESVRPPWSGGFTWSRDENGKPFIATTCQGIGASIWWPNKDHGADEPDRGMDIRVTVPEKLTAVANGRLHETHHDEAAQTRTFHWRVTNPINNYGVNVNIGDYVRIKGVYQGERGPLDLEYWVLQHQVEKAKKQFVEVPRTLAAFEHWFGPYPFYEDSYKLVVVPYLGMEHQSSVTYGNGFQNGYRGRDLSLTGVGMEFDFIIIHESAHEWFGNNISMRDSADMWIHESFANYSESLFVEHWFSKEKGARYVIGCRKLIRNRSPIIGTYGLNKSGSGDMYYKGGNMLHTMRHILADDVKWRAMLRGLNEKFWHRTVTTQEVEAYICEKTGFDFRRVFDQYLRGTDIPVLRYSAKGRSVSLRWDKVVPGFRVPVVLKINGKEMRVTVSDEPIELTLEAELETLELDRNFYMMVAPA